MVLPSYCVLKQYYNGSMAFGFELKIAAAIHFVIQIPEEMSNSVEVTENSNETSAYCTNVHLLSCFIVQARGVSKSRVHLVLRKLLTSF